ncbi:hypothetical protein HII36_15530 [Nonomuraea sp. NN258]|uniref:hypothetical protein n=1 Tax=Nonomuraea antri TaxID=2730852 RepID=UPI0015690C05|nr:hypothetical protein [Nonomuraea antri]NRQ33246.1 hypothetical protein [Nonomuraea antri]
MNMDLEKTLAAELARAAHHAPRPAPDLRARIETGHRKRRRRGLGLSAAAAAAVVIGATSVVSVSLRETTPDPAPPLIAASATRPTSVPTSVSPSVSPSADWPLAEKTFPPIERVWPEAVHSLPGKLPNGRPYHPELFLDAHTVVATTLKDGHADKMDGLWAYDLRTRKARELVRVTPPPRTVITSSFISAGGGRLAWWTVRKDRGELIVDIWTAPSTGGAQRLVTSFPGVPRFGGIDLAIAGDKLVWSMWGKGGLHQVPFTGGRPQPLLRTAGYALVDWPWVGSPMPAYDKQTKGTIFGSLRNLETGQVRKTSVRAIGCSITWCLRQGWAVPRDGEGAMRALPGIPDAGSAHAPARDRFLVLSQLDGTARLRGQVLLDLKAHKIGALGVKPKADGSLSTWGVDYRMPGLFGFQKDGRWVVVNLDAIK